MKIKEWVDHNTFHYDEFWDLLKLVEEKERKNLKISLCIPTLNEEKTIGKEIVILRSELMGRYPLLDECVVIDSGSSDKTREIAASFGADVYRASEILPETGEKHGKGENLWKAIYQLRGDIICYVDGDIRNIHPRFVYGLVAPLIFRDEIKYVKAFYDRPYASPSGGHLPSDGGGRVTEILVRPLFSLFYPELTAIIQPLSGEYAVRREVLQGIPFPIGYGVETGHLLDVYGKWGLEAFAQTDLDQRIHRNQPTKALGKMAFVILQCFFKRLDECRDTKSFQEMKNVYRAIQAHENRYEQVTEKILEEERPPMITLPAYREKFAI